MATVTENEISKDGEAITICDTSKADLPVAGSLQVGTQKALKYGSLITLTVQNTAMNITIRMARTQNELFLASTAVVMLEVIKFTTCLFMVGVDEGSVIKWYSSLKRTVFLQPVDTFKVAVPSLIYTIQNNLIYVAATHLDAATCQVTYQLKILTTAVFSVIMLKKRLSLFQWVALFMLFTGIAFVQVAQFNKTQSVIAGREQRPLVGFLATFIACVLSGFAGVYFEKILKSNDISLWIRNVQLSVLSIPIALCTVFIIDYAEVRNKGFYFGYNSLVWIVILLQAIGGLAVAVVIKFADNILKGFATSLAIVLSCLVSTYVFDFHVTDMFVVGAGLVISSILLYSHQQTTSAVVDNK